jgi:hypothetical protein
MAVVNTPSTAVANANATPRVQNSVVIEHGPLKRCQGFAVIANGDSIASIYRIGRISSSANMDQIRLYGPATAGAIADIGLYDLLTHTNAGTVVDVDFFASAQALTSALNGTDVTFEAAAAGGVITNGEKRIWEMLGLTADPHKEYDIALTLTAAATAAGTWLVRYNYVN